MIRSLTAFTVVISSASLGAGAPPVYVPAAPGPGGGPRAGPQTPTLSVHVARAFTVAGWHTSDCHDAGDLPEISATGWNGEGAAEIRAAYVLAGTCDQDPAADGRWWARAAVREDGRACWFGEFVNDQPPFVAIVVGASAQGAPGAPWRVSYFPGDGLLLDGATWRAPYVIAMAGVGGEISLTFRTLGDFNADGACAVDDVHAFLSAWFAGTALADSNADGACTAQDVFAFVSAWMEGAQ